MDDDLRHRYAEALHRSMTPQTGFADHLDAVLAVQDTELETAREETAYSREALNGAERRRQEWRERAEKAEAKLAALDALHPHTELNWWHPCKNHSITDEEPTLAACPNCLIEPVMGCPRCGDDDCEIRAILHPDSPDVTL